MPAPREVVFQTNPNKDFLRGGYDSEHVERWYRHCGKPLKYLGLPAAEMLDIITWDRFLSQFTTIEREENQQHLMFLRANVKNVEHRLYSLYGDFDDILNNGRDKYGHIPEWPYDIVNLDYFGGFIYPGMSRPKAIRKLIANQANYGSSFLLIITQHIRDGDSLGEKAAFLEDLRRTLKNAALEANTHSAIDRVIDWYKSPDTPDALRQSLYLNQYLRDVGELEHFDVRCRPGIVYTGTGNCAMSHFVTDFTLHPGSGYKTASTQSLIDVINFGVREVRNAAFEGSTSPVPLK